MREITKEQFSDSSTIDGRRVDKAVEDIVDRANAVEKRDMKRRFVQTQYVGGYAPSVATLNTDGVVHANTYDMLPFMPERNTRFYDNTGQVQHEYRVKGTARPGLAVDSKAFIATSSYYVRKPTVIVGVSLVMEAGGAGSYYTNDFQYGSSAATIGKIDDAASEDLVLSISVDNPFLPERRELNSEIYHKFDFSLRSQTFNPAHVATLDMYPAPNIVTGEGPIPGMKGVMIDDQDLNIPVPRDSRVRFSIAIPDYSEYSAVVSGWGATDPSYDDFYNDRPWESQALSWTITMLEGAEE